MQISHRACPQNDTCLAERRSKGSHNLSSGLGLIAEKSGARRHTGRTSQAIFYAVKNSVKNSVRHHRMITGVVSPPLNSVLVTFMDCLQFELSRSRLPFNGLGNGNTSWRIAVGATVGTAALQLFAATTDSASVRRFSTLMLALLPIGSDALFTVFSSS